LQQYERLRRRSEEKSYSGIWQRKMLEKKTIAAGKSEQV
jgi:hypothetical protein